MDVNYILAREQVALALARASLQDGARAAHQLTAERYRAMVEDHRRAARDDALRTARPFGAA